MGMGQKPQILTMFGLNHPIFEYHKFDQYLRYKNHVLGVNSIQQLCLMGKSMFGGFNPTKIPLFEGDSTP